MTDRHRSTLVLPPSGATRGEWAWVAHGAGPAFRLSLERGLLSHFDDLRRKGNDEHVAIDAGVNVLTYTITGMKVPGDTVRHNVAIEFHRKPSYNTFGLPAHDFPRVTTDDLRPKHHAYPALTISDGPLCLWYPHDPEDRRWTSRRSLVDLIEMVRRHLFLEQHYRVRRIWLMEDAPHGFPEAS